MRYADEKKLAADIKNKRFLPVYLLTGDEAFLKTAYCTRLIDAVTEGEASDYNLARFAAGGLDLGELFAALTTMPLLAGRRCIVVDEIVFEDISERELEEWPHIMRQIPQDAVLVLVHSNREAADKKNKASDGSKKGRTAGSKKGKAPDSLPNAVEEAGGAVVTLNGRKGSGLVSFVKRRCSDCGAGIDTQTALYLIEQVGEDMSRLGSECDKLSSYAGKSGQVTREMIDMLSPATLEADVYRLSRHIIAGELNNAINLVDSLTRIKAPVQLVLATLSGSFADLYRAKIGQGSGRSQEEIVSDFGYRHAFRVKNALRDSKRLSREDIEEAMAAILEADMLTKSTQQDARMLLERAVIRASAALRGGRLP